MSERLRSSSSRSSLSIEAPNTESANPAVPHGVKCLITISSCRLRSRAQGPVQLRSPVFLSDWSTDSPRVTEQSQTTPVQTYAQFRFMLYIEIHPSRQFFLGGFCRGTQACCVFNKRMKCSSDAVSTNLTTRYCNITVFITNMLWLEISVGLTVFYGIWQLMYFTDIERHCSLLLLYRLIKISYSQLFITILVC